MCMEHEYIHTPQYSKLGLATDTDIDGQLHLSQVCFIHRPFSAPTRLHMAPAVTRLFIIHSQKPCSLRRCRLPLPASTAARGAKSGAAGAGAAAGDSLGGETARRECADGHGCVRACGRACERRSQGGGDKK
jgi:hypothetical protein